MKGCYNFFRNQPLKNYLLIFSQQYGIYNFGEWPFSLYQGIIVRCQLEDIMVIDSSAVFIFLWFRSDLHVLCYLWKWWDQKCLSCYRNCERMLQFLDSQFISRPSLKKLLSSSTNEWTFIQKNPKGYAALKTLSPLVNIYTIIWT